MCVTKLEEAVSSTANSTKSTSSNSSLLSTTSFPFNYIHACMHDKLIVKGAWSPSLFFFPQAEKLAWRLIYLDMYEEGGGRLHKVISCRVVEVDMLVSILDGGEGNCMAVKRPH